MFNLPRLRQPSLMIAIFLTILAFHLFVAWQDFSILAKNGFLCDDSFYAFQIAKNIASGHGPTFDGIHMTNGFQPLYVLLLIPVYILAGSSLVLPVKIALSLSATLTTLTALFLYFIIRRYVKESIALFVAVMWAFAPVVIRQGANGLETSLVLFLFSLLVYYYLVKIRSTLHPSRRDFFLFGVILGLIVLARVDELLLLFAILLDYLFLLRKRGASASALSGVFIAVIGALIVYAPWLAFSYVKMGTLIMDSGTATRFISIAYAPFFNIDAANAFSSSNPGLPFYMFHIMHSLSVLKLTPPLQIFYRILYKMGEAVGVEGVWNILGIVVGLGLLLFVVYNFFRARSSAKLNGRKEINFLLVFSLLLMASYSFYIFGFFFFTRYYYPIYFVLTIYFAFLLEDFFSSFLNGSSSLIRRTIFTAASAYVVAFFWMSYSQAFRAKPVYCFYDVAKWVQTNTGKDETIGAFQGGAIGYFSGRRVVNLDGKVNREALAAIKQGALDSYIKQEGIDVIIDRSDILELFLSNNGGIDPDKNGYAQIMYGRADGIPGWIAFRVTEANGPAAIKQSGSNR